MNKTKFELNFSHPQHLSEAKVQVEVLPCLFQENVDECNKDVYFDPITKRPPQSQYIPDFLAGDLSMKQTSLQGRRLVGKEHELPKGFKGFVFAKYGEQNRTVNLQRLAEFDQITEWQKDEWSETNGFVPTVLNYLEVAQILNSEE